MSEPEKWLLYLKFQLSDETFPAGYINGRLPSRVYMSFSKQIQSRGAVLRNSTFFPPFLFSKTLVLESLMRANAMTGAGCLSPPFILFPLSAFGKASKVNHMVRFAPSQKIMGSYSSASLPPCAYQSSTQKEESSMFQQRGKSKDFDKSTPLDNDTTRGF